MSAVVFIPLTQGKVAVIDFKDFNKVRGIKWHAHRSNRRWYARYRDPVRGLIYLHRFLLCPPSRVQVDHKDGNGLNNCRYNLRKCSNRQNHQAFKRKRPQATSQFRGVCWYARDAVWTAQIFFRGRQIHLGRFLDETNAARAYDDKAKELFGEFSALNFPI